jgi:inosose dehydratase
VDAKLGCHTITWGGVVGHPVGVTSVKDLFYLAHGPTDVALADIAAAGYAGVELFDGNLMEYESPAGKEIFRELLHVTGLALVAVYSGGNFVFSDILDEELWRIRRAAALAAAFGAEHLVVGGGAQRAGGLHRDDHVRLSAALDEVVAIAGDHGLRASYHPHLTTIVERRDELEAVLGRSRIGFCPDTAHLVAAGGDAATLIRDFGDRIAYVHLKDFRAEPFAFLPLGDGEIDLAAVIAALGAIGFDGWLTVELDEYAGAPADAACRSREYLEGLLAQAP